MPKKRTTDANLILAHLTGNDPEMKRALAEEVANREVASLIYQIREKAGLTQKQLATRIGTTQSVISRLEDADYEGQSLQMLRRVADAVDADIEIRVVPRVRTRRALQPA